MAVAEGSADSAAKEMLKNRAGQMFNSACRCERQMFDSACRGEREDIDYPTLVNYLKELGVQNDHEEEIAQAMLAADQDGNGTLDREEFSVRRRALAGRHHDARGGALAETAWGSRVLSGRVERQVEREV